MIPREFSKEAVGGTQVSSSRSYIAHNSNSSAVQVQPTLALMFLG